MVVDPARLVAEHLLAPLGDLVDRPLRTTDQPGLDHVGDRPADATVEDADAVLDELLCGPRRRCPSQPPTWRGQLERLQPPQRGLTTQPARNSLEGVTAWVVRLPSAHRGQ